MPELKVVQIHETNFRDVAGTLRVLADEVEKGTHGDVGCCAVAMMGEHMSLFGMGRDSDGAAVCTLFLAAANKMAAAVAEGVA